LVDICVSSTNAFFCTEDNLVCGKKKQGQEEATIAMRMFVLIYRLNQASVIPGAVVPVTSFVELDLDQVNYYNDSLILPSCSCSYSCLTSSPKSLWGHPLMVMNRWTESGDTQAFVQLL
jgi:hypothetical protein